jgi:hypothetical protein
MCTKGKGLLVTRYADSGGGLELYLYKFLSLALGGVCSQRHTLAALPQDKSLDVHFIGG